MSAFAPRLSSRQNTDCGRYLVIEGLPARFIVGPFSDQVQFFDVQRAGAGVKYVIGRSPPAAAVIELEKVEIKWLIDDSSLSPEELVEYLEARDTPLPVGERCRPLVFQMAERDFDLLMCNAHRAGCALLMGQGVWIYAGSNVTHAMMLIGAVLVLLGCDHEGIADTIYPEFRKLGLEEQTDAHLKSILAHVRQRSVEKCRLARRWVCTGDEP